MNIRSRLLRLTIEFYKLSSKKSAKSLLKIAIASKEYPSLDSYLELGQLGEKMQNLIEEELTELEKLIISHMKENSKKAIKAPFTINSAETYLTYRQLVSKLQARDFFVNLNTQFKQIKDYKGQEELVKFLDQEFQQIKDHYADSAESLVAQLSLSKIIPIKLLLSLDLVRQSQFIQKFNQNFLKDDLRQITSDFKEIQEQVKQHLDSNKLDFFSAKKTVPDYKEKKKTTKLTEDEEQLNEQYELEDLQNKKQRLIVQHQGLISLLEENPVINKDRIITPHVRLEAKQKSGESFEEWDSNPQGQPSKDMKKYYKHTKQVDPHIKQKLQNIANSFATWGGKLKSLLDLTNPGSHAGTKSADYEQLLYIEMYNQEHPGNEVDISEILGKHSEAFSYLINEYRETKDETYLVKARKIAEQKTPQFTWHVNISDDGLGAGDAKTGTPQSIIGRTLSFIQTMWDIHRLKFDDPTISNTAIKKRFEKDFDTVDELPVIVLFDKNKIKNEIAGGRAIPMSTISWAREMQNKGVVGTRRIKNYSGEVQKLVDRHINDMKNYTQKPTKLPPNTVEAYMLSSKQNKKDFVKKIYVLFIPGYNDHLLNTAREKINKIYPGAFEPIVLVSREMPYDQLASRDHPTSPIADALTNSIHKIEFPFEEIPKNKSLSDKVPKKK